MRALKPDEIRPGLWRWTAPHPEWEPLDDDGAPTAWERDVGCVLYATAGQAVFFDPLVPEDDAGLWSWADERCRGREVVVLETVAYHRRSREGFLARYAASTDVPETIAAYPVPASDETVFWVPEHRALVPGDLLLRRGDGRLSLCPQSWLEESSGRPTLSEVRDALGVLRELDVELILVSHGEPALADGRDELARALSAA